LHFLIRIAFAFDIGYQFGGVSISEGATSIIIADWNENEHKALLIATSRL